MKFVDEKRVIALTEYISNHIELEALDTIKTLCYSQILKCNIQNKHYRLVIDEDCPDFIVESAAAFRILVLESFKLLPEYGFEEVRYLELKPQTTELNFYYLPPKVIILVLENVVYRGTPSNAVDINVAKASEFNLDLFPQCRKLALTEINNNYLGRGFFKTTANSSLKELIINYVPVVDIGNLFGLKTCEFGEYENVSDQFKCTVTGISTHDFIIYIYDDVKKFYTMSIFNYH